MNANKSNTRPSAASSTERISLFDSLVSTFSADVGNNVVPATGSWNGESREESPEVSITLVVRTPLPHSCCIFQNINRSNTFR